MKKQLLCLLLAAAMLLLCACKDDGPLTQAEIQEIALEAAGLEGQTVSGMHTHVSVVDGVSVITVYFSCNGNEYSYSMDAYTGELLDIEVDHNH